MTELSESIRGVSGRIDGRKYCGVPEGHRTTFVAGMADMLCCLPAALVNYDLQALERSSASLDKILKFMATLETDNLRKLFDEYMTENPNRMNYMASSNFLAMLVAKSGVSTPAAKSSLLHKLATWFGGKNSN